jgi:lantibiotic biosynthesis protein
MDKSSTLKIKLEEKLFEINNVLKIKNEICDIGILSGISGITLYHFYYSKYKNCDESYNKGIDLIYECMTIINNGYAFPTYCTGIAGYGWLLEHLKEEKFVIGQSENVISNFDDYLYEIMINNLNEGNYDLLHGALGYGYYFLERYKNTNSPNLKYKYREYIIKLIDLLNKISEKEEDKIKWLSIIDLKFNQAYNFSLSHGMSSLICFFSKLSYYDDFKEYVSMLLNGSISYLLSRKLDNVESTSLFPSIEFKDKKNIINSRLSWCYGDLGIVCCPPKIRQ